MTIATRVKRLLHGLRRSPLHPQWIAYRLISRSAREVNTLLRGRIVNVGSGSDVDWLLIPDASQHITVDYPETGARLYGAKPHIWGDAQQLPLASNCSDTVLLLEVAEHLPHPDRAFKECARILKPGGRLVVSTPFLYPEHDLPYDYHRWTSAGLEAALTESGLQIQRLEALGTPPQTAGMLLCVAFAKLVLDWLERRSPLLVLAPVVVLSIPLVNIASELLGHAASPSGFMAKGLLAVAEKPLRQQ